MSTQKNIGFLGAGAMAEALARGFVDKGVIKAAQLYCTDPNPARNDVFSTLR